MRPVVGPLAASLDTVLMAFLDKQCLGCYECVHRLAELHVSVSPPTIYGRLKRMEKAGLIRKNGGTYKLTMNGKMKLRNHVAESKRLVLFLRNKTEVEVE